MFKPPEYTPDPPVDNIQQILRRTECEGYQTFEHLFGTRIMHYKPNPPSKEWNEAWESFVKMVISVEHDIARAKLVTLQEVDAIFDLLSFHKALLQGPRRLCAGQHIIPFGGPGIATVDILGMAWSYGVASTQTQKGFHAAVAYSPAAYRAPVEKLNDDVSFSTRHENRKLMASLRAIKITRQIRLKALSTLGETDISKYDPNSDAELLASSCPEGVSPEVWNAFTSLLRTIKAEVVKFGMYPLPTDVYQPACRMFYVRLTEPFQWQNDNDMGPLLPKWPLGGPDVSVPELWQMMCHFKLVNWPQYGNSADELGDTIAAAEAYMMALLKDVGGSPNFAMTNFANATLRSYVDRRRELAETAQPPPASRDVPRPIRPGHGSFQVGFETGEGSSSGTKRTREGDSPGNGQNRRGRGRGS